MKWRCVGLGIAAVAMFFCIAARADLPRVKTAEARQPIVVDKERQQRSIIYRKTLGLATNEKYGEMRRSWWCDQPVALLWTKQMVESVAAPFASMARAELRRLGYKYFEEEASAFGVKQHASPEYEIGATIRTIDAQLCTDGRRSNEGGVWMEIKWELFAPRVQQVVYSVTTEGSFASARKIDKLISEFFQDAFLVAFRNALADPGMHERLHGDPAAVLASGSRVEADVLALAREPSSETPADAEFTVLRSSVATVFSGAGSGSGFYINADGYLLTNHHVVGDAKYVKVKLASGRDLVGEVLRSDRNRDVALVKTEPVALRSFGIWPRDAAVGDEVYAIGSPFGERFAASVSKGVLSGTAMVESRSYLQSDAKILPGNSGGPLVRKDGSVVGIATAALGPHPGTALHLFIPIREALAAVHVSFKR